jgi:hypothetical protein
MIDLPKFTEVLTTLKITPMQVYILYILHQKDATSFIKYSKVFNSFSTTDLDLLIKRDFILNTDKSTYEFNHLHVTNKFTRLIEIDEEEHGEAFWNLYPDWIIINSYRVSSKAISKEALIEKYMKAIKKDLKTHELVMTVTRKWKEANSNFATMKIDNYVGSRHWDILIKELGESQEDYAKDQI